MPELPEVETMCRGIAPIVGQRVLSLDQPEIACRPCLMDPDVATMDRRLRGKTVTAIERRGKRVMIRLDGVSRLVIEPRMSGLVLLTDPPSVEHLRLRVRFSQTRDPDRVTELLVWDRRGLGTIRLMTPRQYEELVDGRLGEDALTISAATLRSKLKTSSRSIKVALLDQSAVAG